jgi:hypothetical protein
MTTTSRYPILDKHTRCWFLTPTPTHHLGPVERREGREAAEVVLLLEHPPVPTLPHQRTGQARERLQLGLHRKSHKIGDDVTTSSMIPKGKPHCDGILNPYASPPARHVQILIRRG